MVSVAVLTTILALSLVVSIGGQQCDHGHHHHDHGLHSPVSGEHSADVLHKHEREEDDHDHRSHSHDHHSADDHHHHPHAYDGKHAHEHSHSREKIFRLPEEMLEERELEEYGFDGFPMHSHAEHDHSEHDHFHTPLSTAGLWLWAMGCSLLVSLASLICLILLPLIVFQGKLPRTLVDGLAAFGAGSMLGDALLHQLPHAFGGSGGHSHGHDPHDHLHSHGHEKNTGHAHAHSLEDLRVGLAVLGGILLFFLVEKIVRRTEELSVHHGHSWGHNHHHHGHKKDDARITEGDKQAKDGGDDQISLDKTEKPSDLIGGIRKRNIAAVKELEEKDASVVNDAVRKSGAVVERKVDKDPKEISGIEKLPELKEPSNLVLGYLNLFSDGVHNFNDGLALGSAFLLHGKVGGWSRTLFLLAHEIPQEVGDFGILVRSGFGVFKALAFNFLSALVALAGTALALLVGGNPGHSALIEGFTAGGFIYIAVGAVMPDMHTQGNSLRTSLYQLTALILGMGVAMVISLAE